MLNHNSYYASKHFTKVVTKLSVGLLIFACICELVSNSLRFIGTLL